jgi:signal peptidase I
MILEVLVYVFFINTFLLQSQEIPTPSMVNTMLIGDRLLVDRVAFSSRLGEWDSFMLPRIEIERGMIVTFKSPAEMHKDYVKRVIGMPGDLIRIENRKVYINGELLSEPYARFENESDEYERDYFPLQQPRTIDALGTQSYLPFRLDNPETHEIDKKRTVEFCNRFKEYVIKNGKSGKLEFKVPEGHYFCMGDNRDNSLDSRFWGPLPQEYVIGKPWRVYWSGTRFNRIFKKLE